MVLLNVNYKRGVIMNFSTMTEQIFILAIIMFIGYLIVKTHYAEAKIKDGLSKIIVKVTLPCLIISSITEKEINAELMANALTAFLLSLFCLAVLFLTGVLSSKMLKLGGKAETVHRLLSTVGNVIFVGYPIIYAAYGDEGFFYAIIYWLLNDLCLWTLGVYLFSKDNGSNGEKVSFVKKMVNPNTISFAVAIFMLAFKIKLPPYLNPAISGIGGLTVNLSMLFIGMTLATIDLKGILKRKGIYVIVAVKMLIMPTLFILLFKALKINEVIAGAVALEAAMPAQTVLTILASEYKSDYVYSAETMFVTTVVSLATLPLVYYIIQLVY